MTKEPTLMIEAQLDVAGAIARYEQLQSDCQTGAYWIEFDGQMPTAVALQIAVATHKTLGFDDRFCGFGPNAAQVFHHISF